MYFLWSWGGGGGGWPALQKLNFMQECPHASNVHVYINKNFKINSISMTLTSGWRSGILQKLKPVSNIRLSIN